jgi:hypothetical protein
MAGSGFAKQVQQGMFSKTSSARQVQQDKFSKTSSARQVQQDKFSKTRPTITSRRATSFVQANAGEILDSR